jgi:hypothetical protein
MTDQLTSTEGMTPEEIAKATREGRFDDLLSGTDPDPYGVEAARAEVLRVKAEAEEAKVNPDQGARGGPSSEHWDEARLASASAEEIARALQAGHLDGLL